MVAFYGDLMGFKVIENRAGRARLSATGKPPALLTLVHAPQAKRQPAHTVGLYHTAFRFPGRRSLATTLLRLVAGNWPLQGASDHQVSEAIYLADPEGNGIEIYRDRPREEWPRFQDSISMGNLPLDLHKLIEEADQNAAQAGTIDPETDLGHMHLQVSDVDKARSFYRDLIGMDEMMSLPTATFMSAGGYHHHLGGNTWHSLGAPRREKNLLGLNSFALCISDEGSWQALVQRIHDSDRVVQPIERQGLAGVALEDDDGIGVELLHL